MNEERPWISRLVCKHPLDIITIHSNFANLRRGGSLSKFWFDVILVANLVDFQPLFTELRNIVPLTQNWRFYRGGWGLQGVILAILSNGDKNAKICTSNGFKLLIM